MLFRKDLRRCHHGTLASVPAAQPGTIGCYQSLAASHIALDQAVHGISAFQILTDILHGTLLCVGGRIGKCLQKLMFIRIGHADSGNILMGLPQILHGDAQTEKLLKYEPVPCIFQFVVVLRTVDLDKSISAGTKIKFFQHFRRQDLRDFISNGQSLFHGIADVVLGQSLCRLIYRCNGTGLMGGFLQMIRHGIGHGDTAVLDLNLTVKPHRVSFMELRADIALIEVGDIHHAGIVHCTEFDDLQSAANAGQGRFGCDDGLYAHRFAVLNLIDGFDDAPVLVTAREVGDEVKYRIDAETMKSQETLFADPLKYSYALILVHSVPS